MDNVMNNTMSEEDKNTIDACMSRFIVANVIAILTELRADREGNIKNAEIDKRITTKSVNAIYLLNGFTLIDMKFKTKDRNEMLSFRTFFNAFIERKSETVKKQEMKDYMLVFDFITASEQEEKTYRTSMYDPVMCFAEEVNNDYVLHFLFQTDHLDFNIEDIDPMAIKAELQYVQNQIEEEGISKTSSSSDLDEDENEDTEESYFTDDM